MKKLQGTRFGDFTIQEPTDERKYGYVVWEAKCNECGLVKTRTTQEISTNRGIQCACSKGSRRYKVSLGDVVGKLNVVRALENDRYECKCSCGDILTLTARALMYHVRSCGCAINRDGTYKLTSGYIMERCIGHPRATIHGYVLQHILVIEEKLGRPLVSGEIVHHINEIRWDNRPENLYLFKSLGDHTRFHFMLKRGAGELLNSFGDLMRTHYQELIPRLNH